MDVEYSRSVSDTSWILDASDGELTIRTGVTGRAARLGHRLTIAMTRWQACVDWAEAEPATAELVVEVDSFDVLRGTGGVKVLSGPEKALVRSNALRSLNASRFPNISFTTDAIHQTKNGYRMSGPLQIQGKSRKHVVDLRTEDLGGAWRMSAESVVCQADYGIKPYSLMMGALRVSADVVVSFNAVRTKDG